MTRPIEHLLNEYEARRAGRMEAVTNEWAGKLVVVGSTALGNNLGDRRATPLEQRTYLVSDYWNVANSVLVDCFIHPKGLPARLLIIALVGVLSGFLSLNSRTLVAVGSIGSVAMAYAVLACWLFIKSGLWLPWVIPMVGFEAHLMNYTVFGREVNLASRLESASGRARILISEETHRDLLRDDPELAALCVEHPPLTLKGFHDPVKSYEVLWRPADVSGAAAGQSVTIIHSRAQGKMPS